MIWGEKVSRPTDITGHNTLPHKEVHKNTSAHLQKVNQNLDRPNTSQTARKQVNSNRHRINPKNVAAIQNRLNFQDPEIHFYKSKVQKKLKHHSTP